MAVFHPERACVAVDVGGTFTDVVVYDVARGVLKFAKVPTTPRDPSEGVCAGFEAAGVDLADVGLFVHGTTLGLNALLSRRGAKTCIVTTRGFRDVYLLGRTARDPLYDVKYRRRRPLVDRNRIFEVKERLLCTGAVLEPLDEIEANDVADVFSREGVEAVAICFLHSYANPSHERRMAELLRARCPGLMISTSEGLLRECGEYERTSTTVIDAYVKPITCGYLDRLSTVLASRGFTGRFLLTRSGGGTMSVDVARSQPANTILSGPVGGVVGAASVGTSIGCPSVVTFDMGGTSLDVALVIDGKPPVANRQDFDGMALAIPSVDIHTIGSGGGSIAWLDEAGHLKVGPHSAGADPGPACYGKGGAAPTFTDAALTVGYLDPRNFLGGKVELDERLATVAINSVAAPLGLSVNAAAAGIIRIAIAQMVGAVRVVTVEQGYAPKDFALFAFGGGGAMVAAHVARELGMRKAVVPPEPGNFSALGMLLADIVHDCVRTHYGLLNPQTLDGMNACLAELLEEAQVALLRDGIPESESTYTAIADIRYVGQEHAVGVSLSSVQLGAKDLPGVKASFDAAHTQRYGFATNGDLEVVALRVRAIGHVARPEVPRLASGSGDSSGALKSTRLVWEPLDDVQVTYRVFDRGLLRAGDRIEGPAIVEEPSSTTVVLRGDQLIVGSLGELMIEIAKESTGACANDR